jgi:hypothetical protein
VCNDVARWCLIKRDWQEPYWAEDGGDRWINTAGGYCPKGKEVVLESMLTDDYTRLDWTKTGLFKKEGISGWLARDGKWYPCDGHDHGDYAVLILHSSQTKLMNEGWTHVYGNNASYQPNFYCENELSVEQRNWLKSNGYHGFDLEDEPEDAVMLTEEGDYGFSTSPALHRFDKNGNRI